MSPEDEALVEVMGLSTCRGAASLLFGAVSGAKSELKVLIAAFGEDGEPEGLDSYEVRTMPEGIVLRLDAAWNVAYRAADREQKESEAAE